MGQNGESTPCSSRAGLDPGNPGFAASLLGQVSVAGKRRACVQGGSGNFSGAREKHRLALALVCFLSPCNSAGARMRPTNHLDIPAKQMLERTTLAWSTKGGPCGPHDRYFILGVGQPDRRDPRRPSWCSTAGDYAYLPGQEGRRGGNLSRRRPPPSLQEAKKSANREKQKSPRRQKARSKWLVKRLHQITSFKR